MVLLCSLMVLGCGQRDGSAPVGGLKVVNDIVERRAQFVEQSLTADVSHLSEGDREALTHLVAAARAGMEIQNSFKAVLVGMGLMAVFGIGTVPALLMVARLTGMGWLRSRDMIYKIGSVLMMAVGISFVVKGIRF